jgi:PleD family two-component response regulator
MMPPAKPRVLVIDDDATTARIVRSVAEVGGFLGWHTHDPEEGFQLAHALVPDLIVTDVHMPKINGAELCVLFRSHRATRSIPILLISGQEGRDFDSVGMFSGADAYLEKPIQHAALLRMMRTLLKRRSSRRSTAGSRDQPDSPTAPATPASRDGTAPRE